MFLLVTLTTYASKISPISQSTPIVELKYIHKTEPELGLPISDVVLAVKGKAHKLVSVPGECLKIEKTDYQNYQIPQKAVAACGGWYAGEGNYFYAIIKGESVLVYKSWVAEEALDRGYRWKKVKTVQLH